MKKPILLLIAITFSNSTFGQSYRRKLNKFEQVTSEMYHVDKTDLLKVLFDDTSSSESNTAFCYITCPPGFGKTTNLHMIQSFAQIELDFRGDPKPVNDTLAHYFFKPLKINQHPHIIRQHMARYPVLFLDLAGFARVSQNISHVRMDLMDLLGETLERYPIFKNNVKLYSSVGNFSCSRCPQKTMRFIRKLLAKSLTPDELRRSLFILCGSLYEYFNHTQVIVLIDQLDDTALKSPLLESSQITEAYTELINILDEVINSIGSIVRNVIITGVSTLPYSIENSAMQKLAHYPFLEDHVFTPYFGLTEADMKNLFTVYGISGEEQKAISTYYNAYWTSMNNAKLSNTRSITKYIIGRSYTQKSPYPVKILWTSEDDELGVCISRLMRNPRFLQHVLGLLKNGRLEYPYEMAKRQPSNAIKILEQFRDRDYRRYRHENRNLSEILLRYFFEVGYLSYTAIQNVYTIPNLEVRKTLKKRARVYVAHQTDT